MIFSVKNMFAQNKRKMHYKNNYKMKSPIVKCTESKIMYELQLEIQNYCFRFILST